MMTVKQVSRLTGVSIRTLQYYDKIGLLHPSEYTEAGYRLYDRADLEKLSQILLFRELEFPLKDIASILHSPSFDRQKALNQQIEMLSLKKEHLENLITFARGLQKTGERKMDLSVFDTKKAKQYAEKAKQQWQNTDAWQEYEEKSKGNSEAKQNVLAQGLMTIFADFGKIRNTDPASAEAQALVKHLQSYISENYYKCNDVILLSLGQMYADGGEFTENIDVTGGEGTALFVCRAIEIFCSKQ